MKSNVKSMTSKSKIKMNKFTWYGHVMRRKVALSTKKTVKRPRGRPSNISSHLVEKNSLKDGTERYKKRTEWRKFISYHADMSFSVT